MKGSARRRLQGLVATAVICMGASPRFGNADAPGLWAKGYSADGALATHECDGTGICVCRESRATTGYEYVFSHAPGGVPNGDGAITPIAVRATGLPGGVFEAGAQPSPTSAAGKPL